MLKKPAKKLIKLHKQMDNFKTMCLYFSIGKPSTIAGIRFLEFLEEDEMAFDNLYCIAFQMMDAQWLAKRASYMEFNVNVFE